jgi:peptidyl-prolyl cis-trans isomerase D
MLRGIRNASANWLGKVVMGVVVGFLVISFAIWGIGDIFRGFGRSTVAKVGDTEITVEQFRQLYSERLQQIGQRVGRPITADQARALGLDRQIISEVVADTALDQRARQLGLGITDSAVAKQIREIPAFQGLNGEFDPRLFEQRIRAAGYNEPRFVAERRRFLVRHQLSDSVSGLAAIPKTVTEAFNRFQNERRAIEYIVLDRAQAGDVPNPTPEEITKYFESNKVLFRAPEYRKVILLTLSAADVARWMQITDEEAKKYYEERRSRFVTQGRRQVHQIIFPNAEEAKAAKERIDAGTAFVDIARERGLSEQDIDLGFIAKTGLTGGPLGAAAVIDAAFSLPEGGVSAPVQARTGTALIRVVKIEPDKVRSFEEAADEIRQEIAKDRTRAEINDKHDKIEDARASGQNLLEVAQKVGLTATTIDAVDRSGRDPGGAPALGLPPDADIVTTAFSTDVGVEADPVRLADGGYIWIEITGITPARDRTLEEVKDQVETRWRDERIAERLKTRAAALTEKLNVGGSFADVAAAEGLKTDSATDLRRNSRSEKFSAAALDTVFRTPKDTVGSAEGETATERVVFRVVEITTPPLDINAPEGKRLHDAVRDAISADLLGQYVAQIERDLGATINQDAVRRVVGGETN